MDPNAAKTLQSNREKAHRPANLDQYLQANTNLNSKVRFSMEHGSYVAGMSPEQVRLSIGPPDSINKSGGINGNREQWVYPGRKTYLYFEEGLLTTWQVSDQLESSYHDLMRETWENKK